MYVEELRCREEAQVQRKEDGVRLVSGEGCAEEDDDDEEGWHREDDGQDEGEECRLDKINQCPYNITSFFNTYHCPSSKVLRRL